MAVNPNREGDEREPGRAGELELELKWHEP
jgi:hypothetical protein